MNFHIAPYLELVETHRQSDEAAGPGVLSYTYLFQKRS